MKKPSGAIKNSDAKWALKETAAKGKASKDPNKPKRPASAFLVFMEDFRKQFQEENPNVKSVAQIGKAGVSKWKAMSDSDKAPYQAKAGKRKKEYEKTILPNETVPITHETESQIRNLEHVAYSSVLQAFKAHSDARPLAQEGLLTELRKELRVSDDVHRELLRKGKTDHLMSPSVLASPSQPFSALGGGIQIPKQWSSSKSRFSGYSNNFVGKKLRTKFCGNFYEAVIVDHEPLQGRYTTTTTTTNPFPPGLGRYALVYFKDTRDERREWVDLNWFRPGDIQFVCEDSMEEVFACDSSPESERVSPRPLTKEAIISLNNHSVTFEYARSLFDVDLPTFKAKLLDFNILVWNEADGTRVRIHGDHHKITIFCKLLLKYFVVEGYDSFFDIINMIESELDLSRDSYELRYESQTSGFTMVSPGLYRVTRKQTFLLKTDLDWHNAVESAKNHLVLLKVKTDAKHIVNYMKCYKECRR